MNQFPVSAAVLFTARLRQFLQNQIDSIPTTPPGRAYLILGLAAGWIPVDTTSKDGLTQEPECQVPRQATDGGLNALNLDDIDCLFWQFPHPALRCMIRFHENVHSTGGQTAH
ncbi:hypothetical protein ACJ72_01913 [Emergomyces africanus]|uniref:Uncharacterized protein n=1 Tax=Emergomyces africanus TaxID=1955775 RepID=A0A1B7P3X8_9EURO|nr:hypothetical protein ACJ72_01913 [Emergomyces africanus]